MHTEHLFDDRASLFAALRVDLVARLRTALTTAQSTTLLLAGGTTPLPLYRQLATAPRPWQRLHFARVDERWVPLTDPGSNESALRASLAPALSAGAHFTGMQAMAGHGKAVITLQRALPDCNRRYHALPRPWSAALLGMGADCHTASLFPQATGLDAALRAREPCAALSAQRSTITGEHLLRMSLTPWALQQCQQLYLLITGADKLATYRRAWHNSDPRQLPIASLLHQQQVPLALYWSP